jgi:HK97 family phage portal protein
MAGLWKTLTGWAQKSANPDWGALERFLAWNFGGGASASGIIVSPQTAMQAAAVYSCVQVLAQSVGMLPLNVYLEDAKGAKTLAKSHPLWPILHDQPNDYQTNVEFFEMMVAALCLRGNAYAFVNRTRSGQVVELLPLHPDMVRVEMASNYTLCYSVTLSDGSFKVMQPGEIFHVRGLTLNGWLGISPIAYARESIGLALATEKFGGQLFRNGAKMGGVLEHPQTMSQEAYNRLRDSFDAATSGENTHKTALLEEGVKYSPISMNADEAQFLATRQYQRSEIAAIFRVPPHMIGDLERATFSNIEQQSLDFINTGLMPWLNRFEKAIRRDLFNKDEKNSLHVRFGVASLLRGDATARGLYYHNGILDGWMTGNEARHMESDIGIILNPIDGLDVPLRPMNMTRIDQPIAPPVAQPKKD